MRHELRNESGAAAYLRTEAIPGGGLQEFLTESARAAREGLYNGRNLPTSLRGAIWVADIVRRYRDETVMMLTAARPSATGDPVLARFAR